MRDLLFGAPKPETLDTVLDDLDAMSANWRRPPASKAELLMRINALDCTAIRMRKLGYVRQGGNRKGMLARMLDRVRKLGKSNAAS